VPVFKVLLSRRWLTFGFGAVLAIALFIFLGKWQWDTAMSSGGTLQNLFYAFNWWLFAVLVVYGCAKTLREDLQGLGTDKDDEGAPAAAPIALPALYRKPRPAELDEPIENDPELAAYNAYLAELHNRSAR
jgi:DNA-binding transcriptional regulator of glucitol operon